MKGRGPRNEEVLQAIALLEKTSRKEKKVIWKDIAERLKKPRRRRASVNLWKLGSIKSDKKYLLVPGKVLGFGNVEKALNVVALEYSESAKAKILEKGKAMSIAEALEAKIKPSDVVIIC